MPTILERLHAASAELQHAYMAAKHQRRDAVAVAIAQLTLLKCYSLMASKAAA